MSVDITHDNPIEYAHYSMVFDPYLAVIEAIYGKARIQHEWVDKPLRITIDKSDNPLYEWRISIWVYDLNRTPD